MFTDRLAEAQRRIQSHFDHVFGGFVDLDVTRAMTHATAGGKRLRGFLVLESARLHEIGPDRAIWPASAIEALHAYSLVHDDLPCMDDDDLRRGQPTVHVKWNESVAVLAGDALHSLAFELAAHPDCGPAEMRAELVITLARAAGAQGMVMGQALDMAAEHASMPQTLDRITELQAGKTGALFEWAAGAGAVLGGDDPTALRQYARHLGLAFQIADDILDVEGDSARTGKRVGKDAEAGKATFVSLLGLDGARERARVLVEEACDSLAPYGQNAAALREAVRFVISRQH